MNTTKLISNSPENRLNFRKVNKAIEIAGVGMWEYNCQTTECIFNKSWYTILGYAPFELPMTIDTFFGLVHPEDLSKLSNSVNSYQKNKKTDILEIQYRMKNKLGSWVWLRNRSSLELDEQGEPLIWIGSIFDVSRLIESENEANNKNQRLNAIVNSLSDIIYEIDSEYTLVRCWIPDSHPESELVKSFQGKKVHQVYSPQKFKLFKDLIDKTFLTNTAQSFTFHSLKHDKHYLARATPIFNDVSGVNKITIVIQDITESYRVQSKLKMNEANLNAIIQNTSDVFWATDRNEKIIVFNKAFDDLLFNISGIHPEKGQPVNDSFLLEETAKRWRDIHVRSLQGLDTEFSKMLFFEDGRKRLYEFHINPYTNKENEIIGSVITGRDIDDLYSAKKQAEKADRLKSKFVSTISHEIRTPLNAILGTCYQLARINKQENLLADIEILQLASDNLLSLINDILDFTKLSSGKGSVKNTNVNFPKFIKDVNQLQERLATNKNLKYSYTQIGNLPDVLVIDKTKLHQILTNVISNAVKYTNTGGVSFTIKSKKISNTQSKIQFEITDTGIGIPQKEIGTIFDSFTQSSASFETFKGGTGLGLAITKSLVQLLDGKIQVTSNLNEGSTFLFEFLFETNPSIIMKPSRIPSKYSHKEMKILIAEDNEINAKIIGRLLDQWNIRYDLAVNGELAVQFAKKEQYNLILMDIQMPVMNGFEAAYQIKKTAIEFNKDTPIIALTAQSDYTFDQNYKEGIFTSSILKPFHPESLKNSIFEQITEAI